MTVMALLTESLSVTHLPILDTAVDSGVIAMALYAVWAVRTGRRIRHVPICELTPQELEDFWADDQLFSHDHTNITGRQQ
jgi:hypothetical protein